MFRNTFSRVLLHDPLPTTVQPRHLSSLRNNSTSSHPVVNTHSRGFFTLQEDLFSCTPLFYKIFGRGVVHAHVSGTWITINPQKDIFLKAGTPIVVQQNLRGMHTHHTPHTLSLSFTHSLTS